MSASQSPAHSISARLSGRFSAAALVRTPGTSRVSRLKPAQSMPRKPAHAAPSAAAHAIPPRPPIAVPPGRPASPPRISAKQCDKSLDSSPTSPARSPDTALHAAARPKTDAALLEQMVSLRRAGKSLRQIGRQTGRCMEGVRQALLRYEQARSETPAQYAQDEDWHEPLRDPEPLPTGHPIATQAIWRGLERWRNMV